MSGKTVLILVVSVFVISAASQKFCNFPIGTSWKNTHKWALFYKNDGSLFPAKERTVIIPYNEEFTVSCGPNYLSHSNNTKKSIKARCDKDLYNEEPFSTGDLSCDLRPIEVIHSEKSESSDNCDELGGKFGLLAHLNPITGKQMILGDICLNDKDGYPFFIRAVVQGADTSQLDKWIPLEFDSEYKLDFMKALKFDQIYQKMKRFVKSEDFPNFEMSPIFDETLLGNQQLLSISKIGANYILIPEDYKLLHLLESDIADYGKDKKLLAGFYLSKEPYTLKNENDESMPLYLVDAFEGDSPKFPIPEKLTVKLFNRQVAYEFVLTFNPSAINNDDSSGHDQCKSIPWLKRVNSSPVGLRKLISCKEVKPQKVAENYVFQLNSNKH